MKPLKWDKSLLSAFSVRNQGINEDSKVDHLLWNSLRDEREHYWDRKSILKGNQIAGLQIWDLVVGLSWFCIDPNSESRFQEKKRVLKTTIFLFRIKIVHFRTTRPLHSQDLLYDFKSRRLFIENWFFYLKILLTSSKGNSHWVSAEKTLFDLNYKKINKSVKINSFN